MDCLHDVSALFQVQWFELRNITVAKLVKINLKEHCHGYLTMQSDVKA